MSNDLMTQTADADELAVMNSGHNPFLTLTKKEGVTDGTYARFNGNDGRYISTGTELEVGSQVVMELFNAKIGWLGFDSNNRPHKGPEVSVVSGASLPDPNSDNKDVRWTKMIRVGMITMEGKPLIYQAKADKPGRAILRLIQTYGQEMRRQQTASGYNVPVVELGVRDFKVEIEENGRKIKVTKYSEEFKIVSWLSRADVNALISAEPLPSDEEEMTDVTPVQEIIPPKAATKPAAAAMPKAGTPFRRGATA